MIKQGHQAVFANRDQYIRLPGGGMMPMRHLNGTYELNIYIQEPGFHLGDRAIEPLIGPLHHFGLSGLEGAGEEGAPVERAGEVGDASLEKGEEDEVRTPAIPHDPGRPTRK